jgi:hypothetical protein
MYLVGCLMINEVQHVGMLVDPAFPELVESWEVAYATDVEVLDPTSCRVRSGDLPQLVRERLVSGNLVRFQAFEGSQAGVYEVVEVVDQTDGTSTVTVSSSTPFPADPSLYGNRDVVVYFEFRWDGDGQPNRPATYRLVVKSDVKLVPDGFAELYLGASLAGRALELAGAPPFAIPPDGILLYPTGNEGEVFWGSLDRRASNLSSWSFVRYALDPGVTTSNFRQIVVAAEMNTLPENDPNNIWFLTQDFGSRIIDFTGDQLLLKATSASNQLGVEGQDLTIGYSRIEPFLTRYLAIDVDSTFQVDSGVLGAGDLLYVVRDGLREVRFATLLYEETGTERRLLDLPNLSLSGLLLPDQQGWSKGGELTTERVQGRRLQFAQEVGETLVYSLVLVETGADPPPGDGRIIESRIRVTSMSTTDPAGDTGVFFGSDVGPVGSARGIGLQLRVAAGGVTDQVFLFSLETGLEVAAFDVAWNDGELHTYRVVADSDSSTVAVVVDDVVLGTADLSLFAVSSTDTEATIGFASLLVTCAVEVEDYSVVVLPPSTAGRTLGVFVGGDPDDIDGWRIPRTDTLDVPNSDLSAVVEQMDWRQRIRVRIHRDPGWGVTILRPDLPPPPYFTGDFATQFTEPSAGWINVEYRDLPRVPTDTVLGQVSFGALDSRSIAQVRIDEVRYRVYRYATEDLAMPSHMVLNQQNVVSSGELHEDITVEQITVTSTNSTTVDLREGNITADRVFQLVSLNEDGTTTTYLPGSFEFDRDNQIVTITSAQFLGWTDQFDGPVEYDPNVIDLGAPHEELLGPASLVDGVVDPNRRIDALNPIRLPVIVSFAPGRPVTKTYVCSQPLLDGTTLLNQDTPPFETSQVSTDVRFLAWGSRINDPNDVLNTDPDFILNDPFRFIDFSSDPKIQYEQIDFCEVSEGEDNRLSPFCDGGYPGAADAGHPGNDPGDVGNGPIEFAFEGLSFTETEPIRFNDGPSDGFGGFTSTTFLRASGGDAPPGGTLGDAILFTPLGPETVTPESLDGSVGWSVMGQLYDTTTNTLTLLFFGTESLSP